MTKRPTQLLKEMWHQCNNGLGFPVSRAEGRNIVLYIEHLEARNDKKEAKRTKKKEYAMLGMGIWVAVQDMIHYDMSHDRDQIAYEICRGAGINRKEAMRLQRLNGCFEETMKEWIEKYFPLN